MAFEDPSQAGNEDEENPSQTDQAMQPGQAQQAAQQASQSQSAPSTSGGGGGVASSAPGGGASAGGSPAASTPKPSSSGSWTNLDSYLNANSDQATQMGQQIAGSVNNAGQQAQADVNNLGTNFNNAVQQNTVQADPNAVNQAVTDAQGLTSGQNLSAQDQQAFNQQANATYGGPTDVTSYNGYNQAQQDVNNAGQMAQETQSEAGRGTLLNTQYANTSPYGYNAGENNLDQLLLQNSTGAQAALQPEGQQWSGLSGALNSAVNTGDQAAATAQQTNAATAQAAQGAASGAYTNFNNQLNTGLQSLQQTDTNAYNQVMSDMQNNAMTPADWQTLGVNPQAAHNYVSEPTLANYVQQGAAPTLATYANADQYAQEQALAQLSGQANPLSQADVTQANSAATAAPFSFGSSSNATYNGQPATTYGTANTAAQAAYNNSSQQLLGSIQNYIAGLGTGFQGLQPADLQAAYTRLGEINMNGSNQQAKQLQAQINQLQQQYNFNPLGGSVVMK